MNTLEIVAFIILPVCFFILSAIVVPCMGWMFNKVFQHSITIKTLAERRATDYVDIREMKKDIKEILKFVNQNSKPDEC